MSSHEPAAGWVQRWLDEASPERPSGYCEECGTPTRRLVDVAVGFNLPDQHIYSCTPEHDPAPADSGPTEDDRG